MEESIKISVIIPLYNKENYVEKTIKSVLSQKYQYFEIIIVDDGSTDNSLNVVKQFNDKRLKIIEKENTGVSSTRNRGVEESKYEYIAFLDADDWWKDTFLEEIVRLIKKYPAGVYACNCILFYPNKTKISPFTFSNDFSEGYIDYIKVFYQNKSTPICSSNVVISKNEFLKVKGFDIKLKSSEDFDLWLKLACNTKIVFSTKPLAVYNHSINNTRASVNLHKKEECFYFNTDYFIKYYPENQYLIKLLDWIKISNLKIYYANNLYIKEIKNIIKDIEYIPLHLKVFYKLPPFIALKGILLWKKWISLKKKYGRNK